MTTTLSSALVVLAVFAAQPAQTGRVLILENARVLEGNIQRVGEQYRVKYAVGETWVPVKLARCLCPDLESAYEFLRGQANLGDPDEHLRLARWCKTHGLTKLALAEVSKAVELRPSHAESRHLLNSLQRAEVTTTPPTPSLAPEPEAELTCCPPVEYNTESLGLFVTRVQPILMNACAKCHATGRGGQFKLTRAYANELTNHRATQQNLAAVLSQVNRKQPESSLFLSRAVTAHGDASQPPLKSRQAPAFKTMEEWVQLALVHEQREPRQTPPQLVPETKPGADPASLHPLFATTPTLQPPADGNAPREPAMTLPPPDPFDPMLFNRLNSPADPK